MFFGTIVETSLHTAYRKVRRSDHHYYQLLFTVEQTALSSDNETLRYDKQMLSFSCQ